MLVKGVDAGVVHLGYVAFSALCVAMCGAALYACLNLEIPLYDFV
jgi:hypothetical protein